MSYYAAGVVTVAPPNNTNVYNHNINYNLNPDYYNQYNPYGQPQYGNQAVYTEVEEQQDPYYSNYNYDPYNGNGGNATTAYYQHQPYGQSISNLADIYNSEEYAYNNDTASNLNTITNTNTNYGPYQEYGGQRQKQNITNLQNIYYTSYGPNPNVYNSAQNNSGQNAAIMQNATPNLQKHRPFKRPRQPLIQHRTMSDTFVQMLVFPFSVFAFSMMFMDIISRLMPFSLPAMPSLLKYALDFDILPKSKSNPMKGMEMKTTSRPPKVTKLNIQGPMIPTLVDLIGIEPVINQLHKLKETKKNIKSAKKKGKKRRKKYEYDSSEEWEHYEYDDAKGRRRRHPKRSRKKYTNFKRREKIKYSDSPAETLKNIQKFYTKNHKKSPSIYY